MCNVFNKDRTLPNTRSNLRKIQDSLTNTRYRCLFHIIGMSEKPVSISQIISKIGNPKDKYIYDMVKRLIPSRYDLLFLFRWDKIPEDKQYNCRLAKQLDYIFVLKWTLKEVDEEYVSSNVIFEKSNEDKILTISHGQGKITIELDTEDQGRGLGANLKIIDNYERTFSRPNSLSVKKNNNKLYLYIEVSTQLRAKYLCATDKGDKRTISEIKRDIGKSILLHSNIRDSQLMRLPDVSEVRTDVVNWKLRLDVRGLIKYLLGEIELEQNERAHNERIDKLLDNLSKNYEHDFPFLLYYTDFKGELPRNFLVKLLKDIAQELKGLVDISNFEHLMYHVARRYYFEIEQYFFADRFLALPICDTNEIHNDIRNKLIKYQFKIRSYIEHKQKKDLKETGDKSRFLRGRNNFNSLLRELYDTMIDNENPVVNIEEMARRYEIPMNDVLNHFLPSRHNYYSSDKSYYYTYNKTKCLISSSYLILESKAEELKSLLVEGYNNKTITKMSDASVVLEKNGIPTVVAHYDFVRRSGFEILHKNQKGEFDLGNNQVIVQKSEYALKPLLRQNI